jgi:O-antigen/teichoic acid export membrane protein
VLRHLARNISFASAGGLLENLVSFVFFIYVARKLGVEDFGRYALIGTLLLFFQRVIGFGMGPVAIRALASHRDEEKPIFQDFIALKFVMACAAYAGLAILCAALSYDRQLSLLILISGLDLLFSAITMSYEDLFVARQIQQVPAYFTAINSLVATVVGVVTLESGGGLYLLVVTMTGWAFLFMLIWSGFFCTRVFCFRFTARREVWRGFFQEMAPLAPLVGVSMANRQINMLFLSKVPGPQPFDLAMGLFQPALTVTNAPIRIFMRARTVFVAWAANRLSFKRSINSEFALVMQLAMVLGAAPLAMTLTYFNEELITLLFGAKFVPGAQALALLGWAAGLNLLIIVMEGFLFATDHVKRFVRLYLLVFLINCGLCLALIPSLGVNGTAIALLVTRIVQFAAMFAYCNTRVPEISLGARQTLVPIMTLLAMFACVEGLNLIPMALMPKLVVCSFSWVAVISCAAFLLIRNGTGSADEASPSV